MIHENVNIIPFGVDLSNFVGKFKLGDRVSARMEEFILDLEGNPIGDTVINGTIIYLLPPAMYVIQFDPPDFDPTCDYNWWSGYGTRNESEIKKI